MHHQGVTDICLEVVINNLPGLPQDLRLLTLVDQSERYQREQLDRTFFHDLINVAGGIQGLVEVLEDQHPELDDDGLGA